MRLAGIGQQLIYLFHSGKGQRRFNVGLEFDHASGPSAWVEFRVLPRNVECGTKAFQLDNRSLPKVFGDEGDLIRVALVNVGVEAKQALVRIAVTCFVTLWVVRVE